MYLSSLQTLFSKVGGSLLVLVAYNESESHSVLSDSLRSSPEYWSGYPFPSPGHLPNPGIEPRSLALQADSLPTELSVKPLLPTDWTSKEVIALQSLVSGNLCCYAYTYAWHYIATFPAPPPPNYLILMLSMLRYPVTGVGHHQLNTLLCLVV